MKAGLLLTVAGVGLMSGSLGAAYGLYMSRSLGAPTSPATEVHAAAVPTGVKAATPVRELKPIVVNLAQPQNAWVRLEASLVFDPAAAPPSDVVVPQIEGDFAAFLRTLSAHQLEGAAGLQMLRQELEERAQTRSKGSVRSVIIQTLVIQ
ncbi:MAG: flagellar basal body-associated FliL family protein [Hyphomicrobiales bacterium]|nr:flagellar basal body-associated FliL family protein [Hyphomicrobiales bacterium]